MTGQDTVTKLTNNIIKNVRNFMQVSAVYVLCFVENESKKRGENGVNVNQGGSHWSANFLFRNSKVGLGLRSRSSRFDRTAARMSANGVATYL